MKQTKKIVLLFVLFGCTPSEPGPFSFFKRRLWGNDFIRNKFLKPALFLGIAATITATSWIFLKWFFSDPMNLKLLHMQASIYKLGKKLPPEANSKLLAQIREVQMSRNPFEFAELENYVRSTLRFPWGSIITPQKNLSIVKKALDANVFGMSEPKECVLDALFSYHQGFLSNLPPICLVGPPGVGKTAFATALANALGLPQRIISVAGMDDPDSYFRGFSRTYKGALPGFFVSMFTSCQCINPVVVIDEVDKEAKGNSKGTVQNILLQILDPMQNQVFRDRYLDLPLDVSQAFYILTANKLENIIEPLQDRLLIMHIPNYSKEEIEIMAHGIIWNSISGTKQIPITVKEQMIQGTFTNLSKEPSIRSIKKTLSCNVIRWLRLNHKKSSMIW